MKRKHSRYSYMITPVRARAVLIARALNEVWQAAPIAEVTKHPAGWSVGPEGDFKDAPANFQEIATYARTVEHGIIVGLEEAKKGLAALGLYDCD